MEISASHRITEQCPILNHGGSQRTHRGITEALRTSVNASVPLCDFMPPFQIRTLPITDFKRQPPRQQRRNPDEHRIPAPLLPGRILNFSRRSGGSASLRHRLVSISPPGCHPLARVSIVSLCVAYPRSRATANAVTSAAACASMSPPCLQKTFPSSRSPARP